MLRQVLIFFMVVCALPEDRTFDDWLEKDPEQYTGKYVYFDFEGSKIRTKIVIEVQFDEHRMTLHRIENDMESTSNVRSLTRNNFQLSVNNKNLNGRFVLKYPPTNAKGPIEKGILLDNKFYRRTEE